MTEQQMKAAMTSCTLCPRMCRVDRRAEGVGRGFCGMSDRLYVARAALHPWEEPCISGKQGSGTVFFAGCNMGCVFCQNQEISKGQAGKEISVERLSEIFLELQEKGAANINLVTPTHYVPQIIRALELAKGEGMRLPVVYNSSGYERVETLRWLEGLVDIYLPDFKYGKEETGARYSKAGNYPEVALGALDEMVRQIGKAEFAENGLMKRGVIVRHLVLPGHIKETQGILTQLKERYGEKIYYSIMSQYTPVAELESYPELTRKITKREYEKVMQTALDLEIEQGFFQEGEAAKESFIPAFTGEGVV